MSNKSNKKSNQQRNKPRPNAPQSRPGGKGEERQPNPNVRQKGKKKKGKNAVKKDSNAFVWGVVALVVVGVGAMFVLAGSSSKSKSNSPEVKLSAGEMAQLTDVPVAVIEKAGGGVGELPEKLPADTPRLVSDGKPEIVYIGAEFCPYCAGERWPLVQALTRFGTFTDLGKSVSGPAPEAYPNTPTVTFYGSSYKSDYLVFTPVETASSSGEPLDSLSSEQQKLLDTFGSNGAIPFLDIGGLYVKNGASVSPALLASQHMTTVTQVLDSLSDPADQVGQAINGSANVITAAICEATGGKPADVCETGAVKAGAARLSGGA